MPCDAATIAHWRGLSCCLCQAYSGQQPATAACPVAATAACSTRAGHRWAAGALAIGPCTEPFQLSQHADSCYTLRLAFKPNFAIGIVTILPLSVCHRAVNVYSWTTTALQSAFPYFSFPLASLDQQASRLLAAGAYDAQSAPRPLRIFPEFQVPLDSPYRPAIEVLVNAAIRTLQGYLQVWGVE